MQGCLQENSAAVGVAIILLLLAEFERDARICTESPLKAMTLFLPRVCVRGTPIAAEDRANGDHSSRMTGVDEPTLHSRSHARQ